MTAIDEAARHGLYQAFEELIGPEHTATFMTMVAFDPKELVTKTDLAVFSAELRAEVADRFDRQTRTLVLALVGALATMTSLTLAAVGLAH